MSIDWKQSASIVVSELERCVNRINPGQFDKLGESLTKGRRIFLLGEGRSGLVARMFAMRLMHLGLDSYVIGETTSPSVRADDLVIAISGSGSTGVVHLLAAKAKEAQAEVAAITIEQDSPLAKLAHQVAIIPAAAKSDRSGSVSVQFAGSLFEQSVLVCCDALFHDLSSRSAQAAEQLWARHTNLE